MLHSLLRLATKHGTYHDLTISRYYQIVASECNQKLDDSKLPKKLSIKDVDVANKRVFIRVDFNVPMKDGKITNNQRIVAALPSIQYVLDKHCQSVVYCIYCISIYKYICFQLICFSGPRLPFGSTGWQEESGLFLETRCQGAGEVAETSRMFSQ